MTGYPLIHRQPGNAILGWDRHEPVSVDRFLSEAFALSRNLPDSPRVLNLCQDRYRFLVGFAAALIRGQSNILPPNKTPKGLQSIAGQFPDLYALTDTGDPPMAEIPTLRYPTTSVTVDGPGPVPEIPADQVAAIAFTSGSTGTPQPHLKTWGSMVKIARNTARRLFPESLKEASIVATVPPQHMYGLETSILLPLQHHVALHGGHPFFPEDIREALESLPQGRILITTPIHLKACVEHSMRFPEISFIVSATAPLSEDLAETAEHLFATEVHEIYGCTEAGSLATRRTTRGQAWSLLDEIDLIGDEDQCTIDAPYLAQAVNLPDIIKNHQNGRFELRGRRADLINIGGKRSSLSELNHRLNAIKGVEDGAFFVPSQKDPDHKRLVAFVVTKVLREADILEALRQHLDPVFLPRPIYLVDQLPRESTGKLTRERLLEAYSHFSN